MKLTMLEFLKVVEQHSTSTREVLLGRGYHWKVIERKAEKAADKDYTEYGVVCDRPWLTDNGRAFLARHTLGNEP